MFSNVAYSIKVDSELSSDSFNSSTGLKQGRVLSPMLFNLFLSDFPDVFEQSCHPASLNGQSLNCLLFADDIVLMSESAERLQQGLNELHTYTKQWNLTVNTSKAKVIIFNKGGPRITRHNFTLNDTNIEIVQNSTYLGILFSSREKQRIVNFDGKRRLGWLYGHGVWGVQNILPYIIDLLGPFSEIWEYAREIAGKSQGILRENCARVWEPF